MTYRMFMIHGYPRVKEIIEQDVASGLIYLPSGAADFKSPEVRPYLDKYVRGSNGITAVDRVKVMKALWDSIGSEFGGRHEALRAQLLRQPREREGRVCCSPRRTAVTWRR
nr:4-hydroxyphenylacetate 3-hydroxylase C-terminal domain-containing protein [Nocardioides convexus]